MNKKLLDNKIIKLLKLKLPCKWQKQLLIQGFYLATKSINELVDFYEILEKYKEVFHDKGDITSTSKKYKQSSERHQ